jgi:hypothetical protein
MASRPRAALGAAQVVAAVVGTLPPALLGVAGLARLLPLELASRFVWGFVLALPAWITAICLAMLARSARRAWLWCAGVALFAAVVCYAPGTKPTSARLASSPPALLP